MFTVYSGIRNTFSFRNSCQHICKFLNCSSCSNIRNLGCFMTKEKISFRDLAGFKRVWTNGRPSDNASIHSGENTCKRLFSRARVSETSSAFPFGNSEQLNPAPWLKVARWLRPLGFFPPSQRSRCVSGEGAVSSVTPVRPLLYGLLTPVQPAGSELCPGKAISAFCHVWGRCSSFLDTSYCPAVLYFSWKCVCVCVLQLHTVSFIWWS